MNKKCRGLVLREVAYKESDKILTILTEEFGKISAIARGTRKKNSPLSAATGLYTFSEFVLFENNSGKINVDQAESIELFFEIRSDLMKLALAAYVAEVMDGVSHEGAPDTEVLRLGLNTLYALAKLNMDERKVKATFELKMACLNGYEPTLTEGRIFGDETGSRITPEMAKVISYIIESDQKRIFSYSISEQALCDFSYFTERYMLYHFDRNFRTLDYFKLLNHQ